MASSSSIAIPDQHGADLGRQWRICLAYPKGGSARILQGYQHAREPVELHWVNLTGIKDSISQQNSVCLKEASKA